MKSKIVKTGQEFDEDCLSEFEYINKGTNMLVIRFDAAKLVPNGERKV